MNMVPTGESPLDLLCITTLRTLAIDAVEQARSGHPGTPMGAAPIAYAVWQRFLQFDPADASWPGTLAVPMAGHLPLGNLCWLYDSNHISIEGSTTLAFTEDITTRFEACGWQVLHVADANDLGALTDRLSTFIATTDRPTLAKQCYGVDPDAKFDVPDGVVALCLAAAARAQCLPSSLPRSPQ